LNQESRQKSINQFIAKCREIELSVTPQRLAIYEAVMVDNSHPSPESVYQRIHLENPTISLATVYKTLETFERHGIISLVTTLHNTVRYDSLTHRHHHIVCTRCQKVMDLQDSELDAIKIPEQVSQNNKLVDFSVHFNVICGDCKNS
jgi:Fur family peroxide stress response transcriptional regulator